MTLQLCGRGQGVSLCAWGFLATWRGPTYRPPRLLRGSVCISERRPREWTTLCSRLLDTGHPAPRHTDLHSLLKRSAPHTRPAAGSLHYHPRPAGRPGPRTRSRSPGPLLTPSSAVTTGQAIPEYGSRRQTAGRRAGAHALAGYLSPRRRVRWPEPDRAPTARGWGAHFWTSAT